MRNYERDELNEIRQVHDDTLARLDREFTKRSGKGEDLAQAIKAMVHVKRRLKKLAGGL